MKKLFLSLSFLFFALVCLSAQESKEVFAPFASRLRVQAENSAVKLTWKDSSDVIGTYIIYRNTEEITSSNFKKSSKVGSVPSGTESFTDYPEVKGDYYYAVLVQDKDGKLYDLFIPFRNKTVKSVAIKSLGTEEELSSAVTDITTETQKDSILVTFRSSKPDRELIIYRSTAPIKSETDLAYAQPLRAIPSSRSSFQDFPVPGISYYYAVIDSGLVKIGNIDFKPGDNATILPARIPMGSRVGLPATTVSRNLPLPLLPLSLRVDTGERLDSPRPEALPTPEKLQPATTKALSSLFARLPQNEYPRLTPVVLPSDKGAVVSGGEEYTLKSILTHQFAEKSWLESEKLLKNFLSIHRSKEIEEHARFYLGQVLYFQNKYKDAFMEFLLVRDDLYTFVNPWMDDLFLKLRNS